MICFFRDIQNASSIEESKALWVAACGWGKMNFGAISFHPYQSQARALSQKIALLSWHKRVFLNRESRSLQETTFLRAWVRHEVLWGVHTMAGLPTLCSAVKVHPLTFHFLQVEEMLEVWGHHCLVHCWKSSNTSGLSACKDQHKWEQRGVASRLWGLLQTTDYSALPHPVPCWMCRGCSAVHCLWLRYWSRHRQLSPTSN